jgi:hypothetical protein
MAGNVWTRGFQLVGRYDIVGSSWRVMLLTTGYVFNGAHNFVSDVSTAVGSSSGFEIQVSGYSRQVLASPTVTEDDTNLFSYVDATDTTFSALVAGGTVGAAAIFRYSTSGGSTADSAQELLSYYPLTATPTNGGDITVVWASSSAGAVLKIGTTS